MALIPLLGFCGYPRIKLTRGLSQIYRTSLYQGSTKVKRAQLQALRKEFELLTMKEGEKVGRFLGRTLVVVNKMKSNGEKMEQSIVVSKILRSLTPKFDYVVCSIEESNDLSVLSIDELHGSLLVHEQRMQGHQEEEHVLKVAYDDRSGRGRGRGMIRGGRGRGRGRHVADKACPDWEKKANYAELEEEEELLLMTYVELNKQKEEAAWFLDSGCSNHMTGNKRWFIELDEQFKHSVKLGNDLKMLVSGKGNIRLEIDGKTQVITEVYYVPELKNNLLSLGQLQEKGLAILIQDRECKIFHSRRGVIMRTRMTTKRMFMVLAHVFLHSPTCLSASTDEINDLWHKRYDHLSNTSMNLLQQKELVRGLPKFKVSIGVCTSCVRWKQHRETIPKKSKWRATKKLQLIHSDICGPITPASHGNKRYVLTFIDDYSRKLSVYFLHEKSAALATFKSFKNVVEKESGLQICGLRTDRGGEFTSKEFTEFCRCEGIKRQLTTSYTPQQNGVVERKNRTIFNMVRCLLEEKKMPNSFWPEAVKWSCYILNRSPTSALKNKTPEECWSGIKSDVDDFRVFGCVRNVHVPDAKRSKLDAKSQRCVLLGYSEESKGYKMFEPETKAIIINIDVVFEEAEIWDWGRTQEEVKNDILDWGDVDEEIYESSDGESEDESSYQEGDGSTSNTLSDIGTSSGTTSPTVPERRATRAPAYLHDYISGEGLSEDETQVQNLVMCMSSDDPVYYEDAVRMKRWRDAMDLEIAAIEKNETWELVYAPKEAKIIAVKWLYRTKLNENGEIDKCKAGLLKGYTQEKGVDYDEVFAPVARWDTIRTVIASAARNGWKLYQLDVKSAFLHDELKEDVYVAQPPGYVISGAENKVYKLKKALYGLKQAPRAWFSRIEGYFSRRGSREAVRKESNILIVSLYVDDLIFTSNDLIMLSSFKDSMKREFEMTDLGEMKYFLGVEIRQSAAGIHISQKKYAEDILRRFGLESCNGVKNPMVPGDNRLTKQEDGKRVDATLFKQMVGSLLYLTVTIPDLAYSVCLISRFMAGPMESHMMVAKRVIRYIKATTSMGIFYQRGNTDEMVAYTDNNYARDLDDRRSTSGYVFMLSGGAVAWASKKQPMVTLSTTEAEYVAAAFCACQCLWMQQVLKQVGGIQSKCAKVMCDNSSTIKLARNPVFHGNSKHIEVRYHFLRELTRDEVIDLQHCGSKEQLVDIMTKPLRLELFEKLREALGVKAAEEIN
ncbi:LOW QUALITY PROTEIN: hypothetical protein OSB04_020404 [Centaurea solstitialis]|uniref:Integrase catalytic domain-containing protein n=1 Tax=Centaurea solstitialis TaxID=347529 RepID=A0AA38T5K6_9ASTR|nr:LOW QUALITY PROTEIN: hypothetical protein OSB04_020404 [Centaurea solstitialis]